MKSVLASVAVVIAIMASVAYWHSIPGYEVESGYATVEKAFQARQSDLMVDVSGQVVRLLKDDLDSAQQRFVINLPNGRNVMIVHDLGRSDRVPVSLHDEVNVRGEYEWTETGGMIHWTHHDIGPDRRHGWIDHRDKRYQ
jgi:uncharacterized protein YxjI